MVREAYIEGFAIGLEQAREQLRALGLKQGRTAWHPAFRLDVVGVAMDKFGPQSDPIIEFMLDPSRDVVSVAWAVVRSTTAEELHASLRTGIVPDRTAS
jgi:hypothetical protein